MGLTENLYCRLSRSHRRRRGRDGYRARGGACHHDDETLHLLCSETRCAEPVSAVTFSQNGSELVNSRSNTSTTNQTPIAHELQQTIPKCASKKNDVRADNKASHFRVERGTRVAGARKEEMIELVGLNMTPTQVKIVKLEQNKGA